MSSQSPLTSHSACYLAEARAIAAGLDSAIIERIAEGLGELRARGGRLFVLGVGGSAANASHAVNDFRKLCGIDASTPVDNVAELTARTNDEGWESVFVGWLDVSRATDKDAVFVLSVGGGDAARGISVNLVRALDEAKRRGLKIYGVVGREGGHTTRVGDAVVVVPTVNPARITPHAEAFQAVVWHCLVSHPTLQTTPTKWEAAVGRDGEGAGSRRRAVFLDRDGVLNRVVVRDGIPHPPAALDQFEILPGVHEALRALADAGFLLIVVTNQPDVARGLQRREVVEAMHRKLADELPLDDIKVCWDSEGPDAECYKPRPGMLLAAARDRQIDLRRSFMVGDRWRDVGAGKAAGCFTIFVDRNYGEPLRDVPDAVCADLREAATIILGRTAPVAESGARS